MPLKLEIPDNHLESLIEYYRIVYENFKVKAQPIVNEWKEIQPILSQLGIITTDLGKDYINFSYPSVIKKPTSDPLQSLNGYNKKWSWLLKSEYVIKKQNRHLTPKEIIKNLVEIYEHDIDERLAQNSIPATLSAAAKAEKINRIKNKNGEYVYSVK